MLVMDCDCGEFRVGDDFIIIAYSAIFASIQIQGFATRDRQKFTLVITNSVHAFDLYRLSADRSLREEVPYYFFCPIHENRISDQQEDPLNLSILLSGGKENNHDSPSKGD
jgi:hypothetical protein